MLMFIGGSEVGSFLTLYNNNRDTLGNDFFDYFLIISSLPFVTSLTTR